jgi:protein gp37
MSENTKIEWCDHTFNPWEGCQEAGPGCDRCYAKARNSRYNHGVAVNWGPGAPRRRTSEANWRKPLQWNANACWFVQCNDCGWRGVSKGATCGGCHGCDTSPARPRVFCASLADVFDNAVDREWRDDLATLILNTPNLDWLLLTKRIGNAGVMLGEMFLDGPPDNIRIGATICNQPEADRDIHKLLALGLPNFLSMEPLLGPVSFEGLFANPRNPADGTNALEALDWVIVGGESGPGARPMHPDWVRSLRDQCAAVGTPFLFKQWGEWTPGENVVRQRGTVATAKWWNDEWSPHEENFASTDGHIDDEPDLYRVGKKAAGRLLDGNTWDEFPAFGDALPATMYYGSPDCKGHAIPLSGRTEIEG